MEKKILIDGRERTVRASGLIPKLYRAKFGRDMVIDMMKLQKAYKKLAELPADATDEERATVLMEVDFGVLENVAWIMLKHGGEDVGNTPEEWLDSLDGVFSIYEALPDILDLWGQNNKTTSVPRKK